MRYQSGPGEPGVMDTERWFSALTAGIDGPLGDVLDVGAAEGVMCVLAAQRGATAVTGIGLHDDRMLAALDATAPYPQVVIAEQEAHGYSAPHRTVLFSMMAHWLGQNETARYAKLARKWFCVVFRAANDHYAVPENGTWFPTLAEMDETVGGIRTHEELLLVQDHGKEVWAATYRTDMHVRNGWVYKRGRTFARPLMEGHDLHGDEPFRPTHGASLAVLTPGEREQVEKLIRTIARHALDHGTYPDDFSPRNIIVNEEDVALVDYDEDLPGPIVAPEYLPIWQRTLSTVGIDFDGDLRSLL